MALRLLAFAALLASAGSLMLRAKSSELEMLSSNATMSTKQDPQSGWVGSQSPAATAQISQEAPSDLPMPIIDVYVINLESRNDKCQCMQHMLGEGQHRHAIRHSANTDGKCVKNFTSWGGRNAAAEQGLFCSNLEVWQRAANTDADYIMVFEDDALIKHKEHFWQQVKEISQCSGWKYLSVDMFTNTSGKSLTVPDPKPRNDACGNNPNSNLHRLEFGNYGTHMQLIKRDFLPEMIKMVGETGETYDHWIWKLGQQGAGFRWQPDIVTQFSQGQRVNGETADFQQCGTSVLASDLSFVKESGLQCS